MLPLGSVIKLDSEDLWLITSYFYTIERPNDRYGYFDYKAFPLLLGDQDDDAYIFFNHDDIQEVVFKGYASSKLDKKLIEQKEWLSQQNIEQVTLDGMLMEYEQYIINEKETKKTIKENESNQFSVLFNNH